MIKTEPICTNKVIPDIPNCGYEISYVEDTQYKETNDGPTFLMYYALVIRENHSQVAYYASTKSRYNLIDEMEEDIPNIKNRRLQIVVKKIKDNLITLKEREHN